MLQDFLKFREQGYSVLPVGKNKKPLLSGWKELQSRIATEEEIKQWLTTWPEAQIGIVTGEISNLAVLDVDAYHGIDHEPYMYDTTTVRTGSGGFHVWFRHCDGLKNSAGKIAEHIDVRASGGFVVAPPSHNEIGEYKFIKTTAELLPFPVELLKKIEQKEVALVTVSDSKIDLGSFKGVGVGKRNDAMARVIGSLLKKTHPHDWETQVWPVALAENQKNTPPLGGSELRKIFESIVGAEKNKGGKKLDKANKAEMLVNFLIQSGNKPFLDQFGKTWIAINGDGSKVMQAQSRDFANYLAKTMFENNMMSGKDTISTVIATLCGKAFSDNERIQLNIRTAKDEDGNYWYDLGGGRIVKFSNGSWSIVSSPPILFSAYAHQEVQPEPVKGAVLDDFMDLINTADEYNRILLKVYTVAGFIGGFAHPVICVHGEHGSAKSTTFKLLKDLIDPSQLKLVPPIKGNEQFIQTVAHNWVCLFDNLSGVSQDLSDSICRACTGGGFVKRELYTNDDDIIYNIQHIIGLNGINNVVVNSDLFDRSILIELSRIPEQKRKTDQEIDSYFKKIKPGLLEFCLTTVAKAIVIQPSIRLDKMYRMADFTVWGCAIAEVLGIGQDKFLEACERNAKLQNEESIENSPVALAVMELIKGRMSGINETSTNLLRLLDQYGADSSGYHDQYWPTNNRSLGKKLREVTPSLEKIGLRVKFIRGQERRVIIEPTSNFWERYVNDANIADYNEPSGLSVVNIDVNDVNDMETPPLF